MNKLAWSVKPDWKSVWFEGVLVSLWLFPAGATVSFSVDLAFGAFANHMLSEYGTRDLVCNGRMLNVRFSSRFSRATTVSSLWATTVSTSTRAATLGWSLSTVTAAQGCCWSVEVPARGYCPGVALPRGDWSLASFARPVPHRAGSLAAFARLEPLAKADTIQAGPVSASWSRGRLLYVLVVARNPGCMHCISRHCLCRSVRCGSAWRISHRV